MARPRLKDKRICAACDSTTTYIDKRGWISWRSHDGNWLCMNCYSNYVRVRSKENDHKWGQISYKKYRYGRFMFKGRRIYREDILRNGKCQLCGAVKGINCKRTSLHHLRYHEDDPLKDTIEICNSCHMKEYFRLKHGASEIALKPI
jgi:hypothetical protein